MISLQQVQLQRGAKVLLDNADLEAFPRMNIGLNSGDANHIGQIIKEFAK